MTALIGFWSHALAAILFGALAVWQLRRWQDNKESRPLLMAFAVVSAWGILVATLGPGHLASGLAESARNFAFLAFMYRILQSAEDDGRQRAVKAVYTAVSAVIGLQIVASGVLPGVADNRVAFEALVSTRNILGLTIAAGSLVLVHNLYGQASPDSRWAIRLPMIALAVMWCYDLHLYTVAYLTRGPAADLLAMRGAVVALTVPLFALASRRGGSWRMQISRAATFQSLSVLAILTYLIVMMSATRAMELAGGDWVRSAQLALVVAMTLAAAFLLPSKRARAWARVVLSKHLFQHRYDYREEWLRFTRTMAHAGEDAQPVAERVIKALCEIAEAPAGLLLTVDERYRLQPAARWNWTRSTGGEERGGEEEFLRFLESTSHVVAFDSIRDGRLDLKDRKVPVPAWLSADGAAWAGAPLLHSDRLVGLAIVEHPIVRRPLDWEDLDLFRTAGMQAASYLAEARSQEALANVQRFDEFNRRFAFIIHDIKNLVSQLSLVTRNAERHADNPEFRADMIATLQSSVKKMNDLLARISRGSRAEVDPLQPIALQSVVGALARLKQRVHPIELFGEADATALADPARLEQALGHIVQNAIDASPAGEPIRICFGMRGSEAAVEVIDSGGGMSPDFIRTRLFQPFASTKEGGFGIGAFEAKTLVAGMGGRIEVESREGEGSRFIIFLPAAHSTALAQPERIRA